MSKGEEIRSTFAKWTVYSFVLLVLLVLQNTISLKFSGVWLVMPAVIVISLNDTSGAGVVLGGIFGILWDVTSGTVFGYNAFMMIIFAVAAEIVAQNLIRVKWTTNMLTVVAATVIYQVVTYVFFFAVWSKGGAWYTLFLYTLRAVVGAAVAAQLMLWLFRFLGRRVSGIS